jgi:hypothetical protein
MAITTLDALIAGFFDQPRAYSKTFTPQAAASFTSLWAQVGIPGAGSPSTDGVNGAIPTDATAGAFPFTNATNTYLGRMAGFSSQTGVIMLYDRLWHNSGLSPTTVGNQAVTSTTLTRPDANGDDVEAWLDVYTTLGAGSTAKTIAYTDQSGNASNTGTLQNFVTTAAAARAFRFALAAGDTGVRVITGFDNVATSTSGTFGLILRRHIISLMTPAQSSGSAMDAIQAGLPRIYDDACLELLFASNGSVSTQVHGSLTLAQG